MENSTIFRDVSESLKALIKQNISELSEDSITFDSPAEVPASNTTKLIIYLFQINENPYLRNAPPSLVKRQEQNYLVRAPLAMDLYYMFTPYAKFRETELIIADKLKKIFYNTQALTGDLLQGSLPTTDNIKLNVVPNMIPTHELHNLWSHFKNAAYKLSLYYIVTPVRIPIDDQQAVYLVDKTQVDVKTKN